MSDLADRMIAISQKMAEVYGVKPNPELRLENLLDRCERLSGWEDPTDLTDDQVESFTNDFSEFKWALRLYRQAVTP